MASDADGVFRSRATRWALVTGSRTLVAAGMLGVAFVVTVSPVAVLVAYVLRFATISLHTLSVGPFVPPREANSD